MRTSEARVSSTRTPAPTSPRHPSVDGPTRAPHVFPPSANAVRPIAATCRSSPVMRCRHSTLDTTRDMPSKVLGSYPLRPVSAPSVSCLSPTRAYSDLKEFAGDAMSPLHVGHHTRHAVEGVGVVPSQTGVGSERELPLAVEGVAEG